MKDIYLSTQTTLIITLVVGAFFIALGYINSKKISDNKSHIIGDRNESIFFFINNEFIHLLWELGYYLVQLQQLPGEE